MDLQSLQAVIYYSSTGEEEEVNLLEMVDKKELAWPAGVVGPGAKAAAPKVRQIHWCQGAGLSELELGCCALLVRPRSQAAMGIMDIMGPC